MKNVCFVQDCSENSILKELIKEFKKDNKKIYLVFSNMKDSGFELLGDYIEKNGNIINMVMGFDKKNTTKLLLERLMQVCKNVKLYSNNNDKNIESNICIFEKESKVTVCTFGGNISEGGIVHNYNIYIKQEYDLSKKSDIEDFENVKKVYDVYANIDKNIELNRDNIEHLSNSKSIFTTKIYEHNLISINELLGKNKEEKIKEDNNIESNNSGILDDDYPLNGKVKMSDIRFDDFDIEIELPKDKVVKKAKIGKMKSDIEVESVKEKVGKKVKNQIEEMEETDKISNRKVKSEEVEDKNFEISGDVIDIENMVFKKSKAGITKHEVSNEIKAKDKEKVKLKTEKVIEEEKKKPEKEENNKYSEDKIVSTKKVDLNGVTNLVMQMHKLEDDKDKSIKIPTYVRTMIPRFFGWSDEFIKKDETKQKEVSVDLINVSNNKKLKTKAVFVQKTGQTFMEIILKDTDKFEIQENDIFRIVKQDSENYVFEIVSQSLMEYEIWLKFCTFDFKGSNRKYGIM